MLAGVIVLIGEPIGAGIPIGAIILGILIPIGGTLGIHILTTGAARTGLMDGVIMTTIGITPTTTGTVTKAEIILVDKAVASATI